MTVIVYRNGVMAADSGSWEGQFIVSRKAKKVFKVRGHLLGVCGPIAITRNIINEFRLTGRLNPAGTTEEAQVMVVKPNRQVVILAYGKIEPSETEDGFHVIGSHAIGPALGALHMGASAVRAAQIAIKVGPWATGKVQSMRLK